MSGIKILSGVKILGPTKTVDAMYHKSPEGQKAEKEYNKELAASKKVQAKRGKDFVKERVRLRGEIKTAAFTVRKLESELKKADSDHQKKHNAEEKRTDVLWNGVIQQNKKYEKAHAKAKQ